MDRLQQGALVIAALFGLIWFFLMLGFSRGMPVRFRTGDDRHAAIIAGIVVIGIVIWSLISAYATQEGLMLFGLVVVVGLIYLAKRGRERG